MFLWNTIEFLRNGTAYRDSMLCFRCYFEFDVQDIETFRVMFSMYCTSNFRGLAFSVIDVCDRVHNRKKKKKKRERNVMGGHFSDKNNLSMDPVKEK